MVELEGIDRAIYKFKLVYQFGLPNICIFVGITILFLRIHINKTYDFLKISNAGQAITSKYGNNSNMFVQKRIAKSIYTKCKTFSEGEANYGRRSFYTSLYSGS